jgi:FAD:protein FMN transferase
MVTDGCDPGWPPLAEVGSGDGAAEWALWSTTARLVVVEPVLLAAAYELVTDLLATVELAASRFREDSEISRLNRDPGHPRQVSPLLADLIGAGLAAAEQTDGDVDPTLGVAIRALGYDRDFADLRPSGPTGATTATTATRAPAAAAPGSAAAAATPGPRIVVARRMTWRDVRLEGRTLTLPRGLSLDLGATAKARAADLCAALVAERLGAGVLVSLGGDIATAGPGPDGGWSIRVSDGPGEPESMIALSAGSAIATSSTIRRTWSHAGQQVHHILDPQTLLPAEPVWRTVTVAAPTCLAANTLTTAAMVRGRAARSWLRGTGLPTRLVTATGDVMTFGGWPVGQS